MVVGVATLAATCLGGRVQAQPGAVQPVTGTAPAPAAPKSKIGILNLKYVVTNYQKFKNFQEENKKAYQVYDDQLKPLGAKIEALRKEGSNPGLDPARKDQIERDGKATQRQIQDITEDARAKLGKQESDQLVIIYKEVLGAVSAYAQSHDLELVMHYTDGVDQVEMNSNPNIHQKMGSRALIPVYYNPGVDISWPVLQMLNSRFTGGAAPR
jgi:Skp family chaperone for outer membrane proteins